MLGLLTFTLTKIILKLDEKTIHSAQLKIKRSNYFNFFHQQLCNFILDN